MTPNTQEKIQAIINQYRALGWEHVSPVEVEGRKYPVVSLWPDFWGNDFTAHLNLIGDEPKVNDISLFNKMKYLGSLQIMGHHLTPQEVKTIIEALTGKPVEVGPVVVDVRLEQLLEVEAE